MFLTSPQVPRTFHNGIVGTFMNLKTHNKYFRDVDYNLNEATQWDVRTGVFTGTGGEYIPPGTPNFLTGTHTVRCTCMLRLIVLQIIYLIQHY